MPVWIGQSKLRLALAVLVATLFLGGCGPKKAGSEQQFVGVWTSSRTHTPINIYANGEWEIKSDDGRVMQYGVWQVVGDNIMWSYKSGGRILHDINPIVAVAPGQFKVREQDGTVTTFARVAQDPAPKS